MDLSKKKISHTFELTNHCGESWNQARDKPQAGEYSWAGSGSGLQGNRAAGEQGCRGTGLQGNRAAGEQGCRGTGLQACRGTGLQIGLDKVCFFSALLFYSLILSINAYYALKLSYYSQNYASIICQHYSSLSVLVLQHIYIVQEHNYFSSDDCC